MRVGQATGGVAESGVDIEALMRAIAQMLQSGAAESGDLSELARALLEARES